MHAGLRPQEVSPANIHLVKHRHVLGAQAEVPDLEVLLDAGGSHGLKHKLMLSSFSQTSSRILVSIICDHN